MTISATPISPNRLLWEETVPGGGHWSGQFTRGTSLRLVDIAGGANVSAIFYNRDEKLERYNMPDTLKAQHTAHLTRGHVCYSDMGRILCSITADTLGWHDPLGCVSTAETCKQKYGERNFQQYRNDMLRSGRDGLLIELGKWGLGARDLAPGVNFFSKITADAEGRLAFVADNSNAGAYVDLRFEMNVLLVLSTAPHAMDPKTPWAPKPVQLIAWRSDPPGEDDYCRNFRAENRRGFYNTELLFR